MQVATFQGVPFLSLPAYPSLPTHPSFPLVGCANRQTPHANGRRTLPNDGFWALGYPLRGRFPNRGT